MKLHRIAVTNLNSLYGEQGIDLDTDLGGASLFLIQGPTGSGKSTLMDAVSLALFAMTPRFTKRKTGEARHSEMALAEQLMSRGEGVAKAELEFSKWESKSGRRVRYRAIWSARRARNKPGGRMQGTTRALERLGEDGQWEQQVSDGRAKVVKPYFDAVLEGFTMADFERSMLLAQGRFDAMLHALPEERAAILERLTDTAIYQRLGERAARMRGAWKGRLERARAKIEAISPVSPEDLAAAEAAVATGDGELAAYESVLGGLRGRRDWLLRRAELDVEQAKLGEEAAELERAKREAMAELEALAEHERCGEGFALAERVEEAEGRLAEVRAQHAELHSSLPQRAETRQQAVEAVQQAESEWRAASEALEALRGPVAEAEAAAEAVELARAEKRAAEQGLERAQEQVGQHRSSRVEAEAAVERSRAALDQAEAERAEVEGDGPLVEARSGLEEAFTKWESAASRLEADRSKRAAREEALEARREAHDQKAAAHEASWAERIEAAVAAVEGAQVALESEPAVAELRESRDEAVDRRGRLELATEAVKLREERERGLKAREERVAECQRAYRRCAEAQEARVEQVEKAALLVEEAERLLAPLERIAALGSERSDLVEGEECPLCGSAEHPFVHDPQRRAQAEQIDEEVRVARAAREKARAEWQARGAERAEADRALAMAEAERRGAVEERDASEQALAEAQERAGEALNRAGLARDCDGKAVAEALQSVRGEIDGLGARCDRVEALLAQQERATEALRVEREAESEARAELGSEATRLEAERTEIIRLREEIASFAAQVQGQQQQLLSKLEGWGLGTGGAAELGAAMERIRQRVERYEGSCRAVERASETLRLAEQSCESAGQALAGAVERAERAVAEADSRATVAEQAADRQVLARAELQRVWAEATGESAPTERPGALLNSQSERVNALAERHSAAGVAKAAAERAEADALARAETLEQAMAKAESERGELAQRLEHWLAELGIGGIAELKEYKQSDEWVSRVGALRRSLQQRVAGLEARRDSLAERSTRHLERRPPGQTEEDSTESLAPRIEAAEAERDACQATLDQARATLQMAYRDREGRAAAEAELESTRAEAAVWLKLHELIGVGDGKRFKMFAQALNLEQLLVQANQHLVHLNDRYRLRPERDPKTELPTLEFVVEDQWRPGSTRSLRTLSGGESFLVSLALALGLSDLRTSSMPVETLLLDEGFGTLDPETLDTALAALQQLQASGRQVGIISHVLGLQERIEAQVLVEPVGEGRSRVRARVSGDS